MNVDWIELPPPEQHLGPVVPTSYTGRDYIQTMELLDEDDTDVDEEQVGWKGKGWVMTMTKKMTTMWMDGPPFVADAAAVVGIPIVVVVFVVDNHNIPTTGRICPNCQSISSQPWGWHFSNIYGTILLLPPQ